VVAMPRLPRSGSIATVSAAIVAKAAAVPVMVRFNAALRSWPSARERSSLVIAHLCRPH